MKEGGGESISVLSQIGRNKTSRDIVGSYQKGRKEGWGLEIGV